MSETHTPGPWTWSSNGCTLHGPYLVPDGRVLDETVLAIDLPEFIEDADKALIAAAPDLLAALKGLMSLGGNDDIMRAAAEAAVAKAEGVTNG